MNGGKEEKLGGKEDVWSITKFSHKWLKYLYTNAQSFRNKEDGILVFEYISGMI